MKDNVEDQARYSLTYRAAEARQVMNWVMAGQCGCLIGLRGAGKSNFLRFLLHEDTRQHYLGQSHADFAFVLLDLLSLTEYTPWAICELMLDRMLKQLRPQLEDKIAGALAAFQQEMIHSNNLLTAQRAIERCIEAVCQGPKQRIILLFDEFDGVFRTLHPSLFRYLRSLRDAHKGQLSYLIIAANDLASLRDDLTEVEHFYRLVSRNVCGLGPYSEADARQMIRYLEAQRATELKAGDTARLIEISGGHAGLLKAILSLLWETPESDSLAKVMPTLKNDPRIQAECRKVWESLPTDEQTALSTLVNRMPVDPDTLSHLKRRGLVRQGRFIFSPLFADFILQAPKAVKGVTLNQATREVQICGRWSEPLNESEFQAFLYFYEHPGRTCTKDELISNLYPDGAEDGVLYTLIKRLRNKIEPNPKRPSYLVTERRSEGGYRFIEPACK